MKKHYIFLLLVLMSIHILDRKAHSQPELRNYEYDKAVPTGIIYMEEDYQKTINSRKLPEWKRTSTTQKSISERVDQMDSLALVALFESTNGYEWFRSDNWLVGPVADWYGISVRDGRVRALILEENNLKGQLPDEIADLRALDTLSFYKNELGGNIPESISEMSALLYLDLDDNLFTGSIPGSFGQLYSLKTIWIGNNPYLTGPFPLAILEIPLKTIGIYDNPGLTPTLIPEMLVGAMSNAEYINIANSNLEGSISSEFGFIPDLEYLYLFGNNFNGSIPSSLGNLTKLKRLYLAGNSLSGTIPEELGNLTSLEFLWLSENSLEGTIPGSLGDLTKLVYLGMSSNQLSGSIPVEISGLSNLTDFYLWKNSLNGTLPPELGNLSNLEVLSLGHNELEGQIPVSLGNLDKLSILYLNDNRFTGTIPSSILTPVNLSILHLENNMFTGSFPEGLAGREMTLLSIDSCGLEGIGDMTGFAAEELYMAHNNFIFEDFIDANLIPTSGAIFEYAPQNNLPLKKDNAIFSLTGDDFILDLSEFLKKIPSNSNNSFTWFRDGTQVHSEMGNLVFSKADYKKEDAGNYSVAITNSIFPELTIYSDEISVQVEDQSVFTKDNTLSDLVVYPNPARNMVNLRLVENMNEYLHIRLVNSDGRILRTLEYNNFHHHGDEITLSLQGLEPSVYFVEIQSDKRRKTIRLLVE